MSHQLPQFATSEFTSTVTCRCGPTSPRLCPAASLCYASCAAFVGQCRQQYDSRWSCRWCCSVWIMELHASRSGRKYEHITPLLRDLHWLPVRERIGFKLAVLVFRCLHGTAPPYLANELCRVADIDARRRLRSASTSALVTPSSRRSTIGDRAFFVAAPRVWNILPSSVTASQTLGTFRRRLKTHLFAASRT